MIKGIKKDVVLLKNTGSSVFEEAYFILRDTPDRGGTDLAEEARRIIASNVLPAERAFSGDGKKKRNRLFFLLSFAAGVAAGAAGTVLVFFLR